MEQSLSVSLDLIRVTKRDLLGLIRATDCSLLTVLLSGGPCLSDFGNRGTVSSVLIRDGNRSAVQISFGFRCTYAETCLIRASRESGVPDSGNRGVLSCRLWSLVIGCRGKTLRSLSVLDSSRREGRVPVRF